MTSLSTLNGRDVHKEQPRGTSIDEIVNNIGDQIERLWTEDNYAEWLHHIHGTEAHTLETMGAPEDREDNEKWSGENMWVKHTNVGCRIMTTNVAKKLNKVMDKEETRDEEGNTSTEIIQYIHMVIEYMKEMEADITIIHEPGEIAQTEATVLRACEAAQYGAIVAPSDNKAAGAVILLSPR